MSVRVVGLANIAVLGNVVGGCRVTRSSGLLHNGFVVPGVGEANGGFMVYSKSSVIVRTAEVRRRIKSKSARSTMAEDPGSVSQELETLVDGSRTLTGYTSFGPSTSPFESRLNKMSKWLASGATFLVIVWKHNEHAIWAGIGAALSGALAKALKRLINGKRPESATGRKLDPGMPSSHAQGFMYLSTYASLALLTGYGWSLGTTTSACAMLLMGVYLSWLRVADGLHTVPQILVGGAVGGTVASLWIWCWHEVIKEELVAHPTSKFALFMAAAFGATAYVIFSMRKWRLDQY
ncbi:hypothetical protein R1sor_027004 [Riccia sorocarpa]|uniref:Phosphatidic acid phosphatase type 2/haloperoxidase domain-containing protein n=1 Tax=Riccia sorocarpa TaxID=122646 RepID=A0ABD3GEP5_9MARC